MVQSLKKLAYLPKRARFIPGPAVHILFDGGAQKGEGTAGYIIIGTQEKEIVIVGLKMGQGVTNNEAESWALLSAMRHL